MAQSSTHSSGACASENPGAANLENAENLNRTSPDGDREQPGERLRTLSLELSAAERKRGVEGETAPDRLLEEQLSTRELLLDELVEQLGSWEKEIARRRQDLDRQQRRLDDRQAQLDRREGELTKERDRLEQKQLETQRRVAAAETKLALFSQLEAMLNSRDNATRDTPASLDVPNSQAAERAVPSPPASDDDASAAPTRSESSEVVRSPLASSPTTHEVGQAPASVGDPAPVTGTSAPRAKNGMEQGIEAAGPAGGLATARYWSQMSSASDPQEEPGARAGASASPGIEAGQETRRADGSPADPPSAESGAASISDSQSATAIEPATRDDHETDPAIQDYMTALLGRGEQKRQGRIQPDRPAPPPAPSRVKSSAAPPKAPNPSSAPTADRPRPTRKPAPKVDLTAHMPALRDMANESARSAIHHYSRQRIAEWLNWLVVAVLATLMIGMSMFWFSKPLAVLAVGAAVVVACGALLMVSRHAARRLDAGRGGQKKASEPRYEVEHEERNPGPEGDSYPAAPAGPAG